MTSTNSVWFAALAAGALAAAGLSVAAMGWQWTAQSPGPAWWLLAWPYANVGLGFFWFLVWPAMATWRRFTDARLASLTAAVLAAMLGAMGPWVLAAWLSLAPWSALLSALFCQLCFALFALGLAVWISRLADAAQALLASLSVFLFLFLPLAAYLQADMLWPGSVAWKGFLPWWDILQAARGRLAPVRWPLILYAGIGAVALAASFLPWSRRILK